MKNKLIDMLYSKHYSSIFMGFLIGLWGFWLLLPIDTFGSSPAFSFMALVSPEWGWGLVMLIAGVFSMWAATHKNKLLLSTSYLVPAFLWTWVVFSFSRATLSSTAIPTYSMLALWSYFSYFKVLTEKGKI